jgi:hypothetical protein
MIRQELAAPIEKAKHDAEQRDAATNPRSPHKLDEHGETIKKAIEEAYKRKLEDPAYRI